MMVLTPVTHAERKERARDFCLRIQAPMTRAHFTALAQQYERSVADLKGKQSPTHRFQRLSGLQQARVFYSLAREATK